MSYTNIHINVSDEHIQSVLTISSFKKEKEYPNSGIAAELIAAIETLEFAKELGHYRIDLHSSNADFVRGIDDWSFKWKQHGWKNSSGKMVKNKELWERLQELVYFSKMDVRIVLLEKEQYSVLPKKHKEDTKIPQHMLDKHKHYVEIPTLFVEAYQQVGRCHNVIYCRYTIRLTHESFSYSETKYNHEAPASEYIRRNKLDILSQQFMALLGAIVGIKKAMAQGFNEIEIKVNDAYLYNGITKYMNKWSKNRWRKSGGKTLKYADLWKELYALFNSGEINIRTILS